jgi:hypothetical protein
MKKIFTILFYMLLTTGIVLGGWKLADALDLTPKTAEQYQNEIWLTMSRIDPEGFTVFGSPSTSESLRLPGSVDPFAFLSELNDPRKGATQNRQKIAAELLVKLNDFDQNKHPELKDIGRKLESLSAPLPYPMADVLAIQSGELYQTPFLMCYAHPVRNPSHAEAYIERLRALGSKAAIWSKRIKGEVIGSEQVPPEAIEAAAAFCQRFTSIPVLKHPLYISFARRMARKGEVRVPQDEALKMLDRVASLLEDRVIPEWKALASTLRMQQTPSSAIKLQRGLKKELGIAIEGNPANLEQSILSFADSLQNALDSLPNISSSAWLRASSAGERPWLDSLKSLIYVMRVKSTGIYQELPDFESLQVKIQDSLQQAIGLPYWYLPGDEAGKRKAKLFVHPTYFGNASGVARNWLIQAGIPGAHTRFVKRSERMYPLDAVTNGFGLYGALLADEIGLNTFMDKGTPPFPEGKSASLQLQLLACELALLDLGIDKTLSSLPEALKNPFKLRAKSRPGLSLASWLVYQDILQKRAEAKQRDGNLFYLAKFNEEIVAGD